MAGGFGRGPSTRGNQLESRARLTYSLAIRSSSFDIRSFTKQLSGVRDNLLSCPLSQDRRER